MKREGERKIKKVGWLIILLLVVVPATCMGEEAQVWMDGFYEGRIPVTENLGDGDYVLGSASLEEECSGKHEGANMTLKQIDLSTLQGPSGAPGLQGPKGDSFDDRTRYYLDLSLLYEVKRNLLVGAYTKYNCETSCLDEVGMRVSYQLGRSWLENQVEELRTQLKELKETR